MPASKIPSPARSQGAIFTPRKQLRRTRSVSSPATTNLRLSSIIESYKVSPLPNRQSVLNDNTDIDMPRCESWWKKIDDNSRDVLELLERKELVEVNNVAEEFDVEILSQEKKNYTLDLPESSDAESINSIVIPQRKLFTQKDNHPQLKFGQIKNNRETLQKLNKSYMDQDKEFNIKRKTLFSQPSRPRSKPVFPAALLNMSANKTANKTKEIAAAEVKGQVRSLFGVQPGTKRKNMFADFIVSESEDEISEVRPKIFGFQNRNDPKRRGSLMSRHSPTSSIDLEMDDWILLPSSTMVENQIDEQTSPAKRIKLSSQLESKDSDENINRNNTINQTIQAKKSVNSKDISKSSSNIHYEDDKNNEINITPRNANINNSRVTRSMGKSLRENSVTASDICQKRNISTNQTNKKEKNIKNVSQRHSHKVKEIQSGSINQPHPDDDFTLEYDNDDNEVLLETGTSLKNFNKSPEDKAASNLNVDVDVVDHKSNFVKEISRKINNENFVEQQKSTNKSCENKAELLDSKENDMECNEVSNYSMVQNNSQEMRKVAQLSKECITNVQKINKSIDKKDKNKSKSIINSVDNYNEDSIEKDLQKERTSQTQNINNDVEKKMTLNKSSKRFNNENAEGEMEIENEHNESDNNSEQSDIENAKESTQIEHENFDDSEHQENEKSKNITAEGAGNDIQEVTNENNTDERDKEIKLNDQHYNLEDKTRASLPNVICDTTGKNNRSPEVILHNKTKQMDSFIVQGRNTSVRKSKSIIFHKKLEAVKDMQRSTGFSDETGNSSAEGSGWDSHRTTRKTLRQTFGKDFTPRKSLRALVMEKTAKLQANFTKVVENIKSPQANSTEYDHVQDKLYFDQETELEEVENIEMVQAEDNKETVQIEGDQQVNVRCVTERIEESNATKQFPERNEKEQFNESDHVGHSESFGKYESEQFKDIEEVKEPEEMEDMRESETREEIEDPEGKEIDDSEEDGVEMLDSEEAQEAEESEVREEIEESEEEEVENSKQRGEMKDSEERGEMVDSEEGEEVEESEVREGIEEFEDRQEVDDSAEREEMEESENEERVTEQFEEIDETDQFEDRDDTEQSDNGERDNAQRFEERDGTVLEDETMVEESDRRASSRSRQTSLETYLQKIKQDNIERRRKRQEELRNSLKNPKRETFEAFGAPQRPVQALKVQKPKAKRPPGARALGALPPDLLQDMKYKPPKRFRPNNASWITNRLYKFLENKLEPKYDYKARVRAERLSARLHAMATAARRDRLPTEEVDDLKREMARLAVVTTHYDFYEFCREFLPREIRIKVVPDIVNNIPLPRHGVFSDILQ